MPKDDCPEPPYQTIIGTCSLTIRKTDGIMRVLKDDGTAVDVDIRRLTDIPARKGDRVGVAAVPFERGYYLAVYCRNLETNREFLWEPIYRGCFIATMIYGKDSNEVKIFRSFRDQFLSKSFCGTVFIEIYYSISPQLIKTRGIEKLTPIIKKFLSLILVCLRNISTFREKLFERDSYVQKS